MCLGVAYGKSQRSKGQELRPSDWNFQSHPGLPVLLNMATKRSMPIDWQRLHALAREEVEATLSSRPSRARALPVTFERCPNAAQRRDGIASDTLGLFVGSEFAHEESAALPLPPQIILFLRNLWDFAEADEEFFCEEVHTTYLHELGHYLGLDEDDLFPTVASAAASVRLA